MLVIPSNSAFSLSATPKQQWRSGVQAFRQQWPWDTICVHQQPPHAATTERIAATPRKYPLVPSAVLVLRDLLVLLVVVVVLAALLVLAVVVIVLLVVLVSTHSASSTSRTTSTSSTSRTSSTRPNGHHLQDESSTRRRGVLGMLSVVPRLQELAPNIPQHTRGLCYCYCQGTLYCHCYCQGNSSTVTAVLQERFCC